MADIHSTEEWRPVLDWDGYMASSLGRIKGPRKILSQRDLGNGYVYVALRRRGENKAKTVSVHRLVSEAFLGRKPVGMQTNHINSNRGDNRIENLEYLTPSQNCRHRINNGTFPVGENNGRAKLTAKQVKEIRERRAHGEKLKPLAEEFGVHKNTIWWAVRNITWQE